MSKNLKTALFSSILLLLISYPILGLKLSVVGISLQVQGASAQTLWTIGIAAALLFIWHLVLRDRLMGGEKLKGALPSIPANLKDTLTLPSVQRWIMLALFVVALAWPFFGSRAAVDIATLILIYVMLGIGLNIVVGLAGLLDLGYVGFYAVGAYTYALLAEYAGFGFWTALPIAGLMAATFGCLLGFPVLRLRGDYLAIVTLGFGEIIRLVLNNWLSFTGGPNGVPVPSPTFFGLEFGRRARDGGVPIHEYFGFEYNPDLKFVFIYAVLFLVVLAVLYIKHRLTRMPVGRAWEALREDEIACRSMGLNHVLVKLSAFTIGASTAGLAGVFFASYQGFVNPTSFTFFESALILAIVVLGGMGSTVGVVIAAFVLTVAPELLRSFSEYRVLLFGVLMVLMMIWRPRGLIRISRTGIKPVKGALIDAKGTTP